MNTTVNTNTDSHTGRTEAGRSTDLFWPIVLIGAGVVLLMDNQGMLVNRPLALLGAFWPVIFILIGVDIIFSRMGILGTIVSGLMGLAVVGAAIVALTAPGLTIEAPLVINLSGPQRSAEMRTERVVHPLAGVASATVQLDLPSGTGGISAARDTANLVEADVNYYGSLVNEVRRFGDTAAIRVGSQGSGSFWGLFDWGRQRWDVRLNSAVAYDFDLDTGSGSYVFDLTEFKVRGVALNQGSGNSELRIPEGGQYRVRLDVGSGASTIVVPRGLAFRVNYDIGSGSLNVRNAASVSGSGKQGVYETPGFLQSGSYALIDVELGSGSVTIR